ncbi:hypothetical protein [Armatimonas sp.]|uniref:hypothetical protein n=1 Tax=Armatimonas sp. TaxID=1872638 RepID=UPI00286A2779|nr:hypothetical protein [Armatimonas sp.]
MRSIILFSSALLFLLFLGGCAKDATPQEAVQTAGRTMNQAEALQKETQKRVTENDALTGGK